MAFDRPWLLGLLALLPALWYLKRRLGRPGIAFPLAPSGGKAFSAIPALPRALSFISALLFWIGLGLVIVAAAGPAKVSRSILYLSRGNEINFVLDVSPSMAAEDFQPNRLEAAKAIIDGFLQGRRNESIGLVAFGAEAALICPPTLDYPALRRRLSELVPGQFGDGTALGAGMGTALAHSSTSGAPRKFLILLTDGENNAGALSPATAANLATKRGVQVSVIGVGSKGDVPLTYTDPATGQKRSGSYHSEFDRGSLEGLAREGGGTYYAAENPEALAAAFASISDSSASLARTRSISREESLVRIVLALGLGILVLARLLGLWAGGDFL